MSSLDSLLPTPRLIETHAVDLDAPPRDVWQYLRHEDLADSPLVRALFAVRTLPSRLVGHAPKEAILRMDDFHSTPTRPGFHLLAEDPQRALTVGAIGKVWQLDIPFHHVATLAEYRDFAETGWIKVAWEMRLLAQGEDATHLEFEVRVDATDDESWRKFRRYFRLIGPGSHFIRQVLLRGLQRRFGSPDADADYMLLPGDELLADALGQSTQGVTIAAPAHAVWPWLVQMGCHRAGFYSVDILDNGGVPSAREIHPELQELALGQVLPATPDSPDGFEVLAIEPDRYLVLGGLFDVHDGAQLPFAHARPKDYWQVTWAFVLEPRGPNSTQLYVRARAAFSPSERFHLAWIRPVHALMQSAQLHNLALRAEGRLARDSLEDVTEGVVGAATMLLAFVTPFLRQARNHWGLTAEEAERPRPGDELIPMPLWSWTHAVEVDALPEQVWPWVAQIGADRAGFYSYQWLENLAGCNLKNAEALHAEWIHRVRDSLILHPKAPPIPVVSIEPGRSLVAFAAADEKARAEGRPWAAVSWAFLLEPLEDGRTRIVSRFRSTCSDDLKTRATQGPSLLEPIGFAMDRRMLLGIVERVEAVQGG
jgi:hypothetical protein